MTKGQARSGSAGLHVTLQQPRVRSDLGLLACTPHCNNQGSGRTWVCWPARHIATTKSQARRGSADLHATLQRPRVRPDLGLLACTPHCNNQESGLTWVCWPARHIATTKSLGLLTCTPHCNDQGSGQIWVCWPARHIATTKGQARSGSAGLHATLQRPRVRPDLGLLACTPHCNNQESGSADLHATLQQPRVWVCWPARHIATTKSQAGPGSADLHATLQQPISRRGPPKGGTAQGFSLHASSRVMHTLDTSMPQEGSGGLGLRPSLAVGNALPPSSPPTDNGSGPAPPPCSDAAGTGPMLPCVRPPAPRMAGRVHPARCGPTIATSRRTA